MERETKNPNGVGRVITRRQLLGLESFSLPVPAYEANNKYSLWKKRMIGCMAASLVLLGIGQGALLEAESSSCDDTDIACQLAKGEMLAAGATASDSVAVSEAANQATAASLDPAPITEVATTLPVLTETVDTTVDVVPGIVQETVLRGSSVESATFPRFEARGRGIDISYPNCDAEIPADVDFGIVGVNGGRTFTPNNCLAEEAANFSNLALYVNTSYPGNEVARDFQNGAPRICGPEDLGCIAYNYGYQSGRNAVEYARSQGVKSTSWWLDVETANSWRGNYAENIQSLQGEVDAIKEHASQDVGASVDIGFYSVPFMWQKITGGWQNGYPAWVATGKSTAEEAAPSCTGKEFTGGRTVMVQYVDGLDNNYVC